MPSVRGVKSCYENHDITGSDEVMALAKWESVGEDDRLKADDVVSSI